MLPKLKVYLETTVPNYVFNDHLPDEQKVAKEILRKAKTGELEAYVSQTVIDELTQTPDKKQRQKLLELIRDIEILPVTDSVRDLANEYVKRGIIPKTKLTDALHIAAASIHTIRLIASWNIEHIVKVKTKLGVETINTELGYFIPIIVRPEEVLDHVKQ